MAYLIGTDEAGYGPNLGPLVVAATVWRSAGREHPGDLYERLANVITADSDQRATPTRLTLADSKQLYHSGAGLARLERGLFGVLGVTHRGPWTWRDFWQSVAPAGEWPWQASREAKHFEAAVPCEVDNSELTSVSERLRCGLQAAGIEFHSARATVLYPRRFNDEVDRAGSKGAVLSATTLHLVRDLIAPLPDEPMFVLCDRHGGRRHYADVLQEAFPDYLVEIWRESEKSSCYRWGPARRRVEFEFAVRGERFLPAAVASMLAKYLRERAMEAFNAFWIDQVPGLARTAGYPVDARRFRDEIRDAQTRLGMDDHEIWRNR